jgi:zinc transporter ZupT
VFGLSPDSYGVAAAVVAALVGTLGLLSMAATGNWGKTHAAHFSAFSVGYLTVAILFHLLPDTLTGMDLAVGVRWVCAGFVALLVLGVLVRVFAQDGVKARNLAIGFASIIALGTHSFVDGLLYEAIFHDVDPKDASIAVAGLLLHEFPEGVIAYFLLKESGLGRSSSVFLAFLAASMTTILGSLAAKVVIVAVDPPDSGPLLALSAGALIYVVGLHLAPHAQHVPNRRGYVYASLGIAAALLAVILRHWNSELAH